MANDKKKWYLSKTVWAAIVTALVGGYMQVDVAMGDVLPNIPVFVISLLGALGLYGRVKADKGLTL